MKILNGGRAAALGLTLIAAGLAAPPAAGAAAAAAPQPDPDLVSAMREDADGRVAVRANRATGEVGFVRVRGAEGDLLPGAAADTRTEAAEKATAYLETYAPAFGAEAEQLEQSDVFADRYGWSVSYSQTHDGVPVFGAELRAHVDKQGRLTSVNGFVAPDVDVATTPRFGETEAAERALAMVKDRPAGHEDALPAAAASGLEVLTNELMIYRMGSTRGMAGEARLAWVLEVSNSSTVRETIILDAMTGKKLNRWSMMTHALERELYEGSYDPENLVWKEGDPFPDGLDPDQQNEVLAAAEAYWLFMNTFGYDSYDGQGSPMITVNNDPTIDCPNANWNGVTTNYCTGVTGDDTVAHEWGHAYTEYTSGLIYQWQSGAMNEAYSDIWGEVVDMLNTRQNQLGEDPADPVLRTPGQCSNFTRSAVDMTITAPAEVAGPCEAIPASFGPVFGQEPVTGTAVVATDAANEEGPSTTDGCTPYDNAAEVEGQWAYVDRGTCTFQVKADVAEAAGAVGIVVGNTEAGAMTSMSGSSDLYGVMVSFEDGVRFKEAGGPVTFEISAVDAETDQSYRWLSGEDDPAFGGAIRDMWNPNCYGDPGRVSDEEYTCDEENTDSGGVHTNSGVVNRTFAILVDGLPGVVEPIGLDKAANIFWHTQTNHLTPTSGFPELADGLEASCATLIGAEINQLTIGSPTQPDGSDGAAEAAPAEPVTAADCAAVADAIAETELRTDPVKCNFQPLLDKGEVSCGEGLESHVTWSEDFEDGLDGWTQDHEFGNYGGLGFPELGGAVHHPWETTTDMPVVTPLPGGAGTREPSTVAYGPDPTTGSCAGDEEDESSRNGLISPEIEMPDGFQPRLSFDHLVATEALYDGGNVKFSTDGGETFEEVPADAWILNGPRGELETAAAGNSNPMAGQRAFTGTDGGESTGSWGTSVISLPRLGLIAGDTVRFRFDMGRDGCNGVDGWYVDDVQVTICEEDAPEGAETATEAVTYRPSPAREGRQFQVQVDVTADGAQPTGEVEVSLDGATLGTATLKKHGTTWVKVGDGLPEGQHTLTVSYLGDDGFAPSEDTIVVEVVSKGRH
ncbi:MAG TPA: M4 family metallopeptidase [Nocardioides sp.]|nr:M4 family metallopeptidase [Nocardioides sp.]